VLELKRVALITEILTIGGADRQISAICTYLNKKGYAVTIYSVLPRSNYPSLIQNAPAINIVYSMNLTRILFICGMIRYIPDILTSFIRGRGDPLKTRRYLLSIKSGLIETDYVTGFYSKKILGSIAQQQATEPFSFVIGLHFQVLPLLGTIQRELGIPTRYIEISSPRWRSLNNFHKRSTQPVINVIDRIIVPSKIIGEELKTYDGLRKSYTVVPLVLQMPSYHKKDENNISTFGIATRLSREKNQDLLIRIMDVIRTIDPLTPIKLILVGDGPEKDRLVRLKKDLNLEDYVIFTGSFERVEQFIDKIDIVTLLSDVESTPATLLEALYFGKPIIATDVGSISDIVIDGFNGYIVDKKNLDEIAGKIIALAANPSLYETLSKNSRSLYNKIYCKPDILIPLLE
jgi:glycosyltransferase involved in cell wall biosynthesis